MAEVAAAPAFKKRGNKGANARKRPATPPPDDSDSTDYTDDEAGVRIKRRKTAGLAVSSTTKMSTDLSKNTEYAADRNAAIKQSDDATKLSSWYTDAALAGEKANPVQGVPGLYKGTAAYDDFIAKNPDRPRNVGPVKAPTNVRTITVTDFAPDVCKDYKLTGYCGFGDSCKFLHTRDNYKQGWQLDKEWEKAGKEPSKDKKGEDDMTEEEKMLKDIPFKCIICKDDYKNPIVTKCGHYFCEKCAMQRYIKEKKKTCANCGADTAGSFAIAKKLKELLTRKKHVEDERVKAAAEVAT